MKREKFPDGGIFSQLVFAIDRLYLMDFGCTVVSESFRSVRKPD